MAKLREKCRLIASQSDIGDHRPELGDGIRGSYLGSYVIFFYARIADYNRHGSPV